MFLCTYIVSLPPSNSKNLQLKPTFSEEQNPNPGVNGKRSYLCWISWFNKKKEETLYVFGHAFFGFL
ncbi:hypothetical protein CMV_020349 [Castanea mollissima]|uniref:Uncharacterized protein n=1 Tax=Castanea mollissima TaxID=60419 RepID=A0A8J4QNB8_9ROSI|nr:hypothetical protein CMV_020349 [Castanea mollissima]